MNTLAAVVRGRGPDGSSTDTAAAGRTVVGVVGFDFLYPIMNDMLPGMTGCAAEVVREIGRDSSKAHPACWLIELSLRAMAVNGGLAFELPLQHSFMRATTTGSHLSSGTNGRSPVCKAMVSLWYLLCARCAICALKGLTFATFTAIAKEFISFLSSLAKGRSFERTS